MQFVNIYEARAQLSRLLDAVAAGEEIVIARAGKPVARLMPLATRDAKGRRTLGALAGRLHVPEDFDAPLPDAAPDASDGR